jgi:hypothetical protein
MSDEMRNGRARLIEAGKTNTLPEFGSAGYWQMAHALGGLETAGVYIDSGLMSRKQFVAIWHHQLQAIRTGTGLMAAHRIKDLDNWAPWPHLRPLLDAAASFYDKSLICCQQPGQWPPLNRSQAARSTTRNVDRRQQPRQQPPPTKPVIYEPENSLERPEAAEWSRSSVALNPRVRGSSPWRRTITRPAQTTPWPTLGVDHFGRTINGTGDAAADHPNRRRAASSTAARSTSSSTCAYVFMVSAIWLCPSVFITEPETERHGAS